ncbi:hypothetical protein Pan241w_37380 [Gimesia alba]|uniref:Uncharacterized protein n=1 Tax=Gimesia alba TaxID=2527973 RepID=A0A517RIC6_9PLAN|nr:hypothetical protein [Gimesia alba]QDT43636.1 hypothetical protein Pan241w_37380 [Gimesia alba]
MSTQHFTEDLESKAWDAHRAFLVEAERSFGPRDDSYTVTDIVQEIHGPTLSLNGHSVTLVVGPNATKYFPALIANVAHETLHTLNPVTGNATMLEEGAAIYFELQIISSQFSESERKYFWNHLPETYRTAFADFETLLGFDQNAGLTIRKEFGSLSDLDKNGLRKLFPELQDDCASRLVTRQRMRPNAG